MFSRTDANGGAFPGDAISGVTSLDLQLSICEPLGLAYRGQLLMGAGRVLSVSTRSKAASPFRHLQSDGSY